MSLKSTLVSLAMDKRLQSNRVATKQKLFQLRKIMFLSVPSFTQGVFVRDERVLSESSESSK